MKIKTKYKVLIILAAIAVLMILIFDVLGGYTSAAYVRANWVEVTPRVNGYLKEIYVQNNQFVKTGTPLFSLDRYPFKLEVDKAQANLDSAKAQKLLLEDQIKTTQSQVDITKNELSLANLRMKRQILLFQEDAAVSKQTSEDAQTLYLKSAEDLATLIQNLKNFQDQYKEQLKNISLLTAELNIAKYNYDESLILAPFDGYVTNMYLMPGPFVEAGKSLFGLAQTQSCWIEANFKEFWVGGIKPGQTAWISVDSNPFTILKGRVVSITNAVNRLNTPQMVLPYIEPTIDWIRLSYRFTVIIEILDQPKGMQLRMGADARVFVVY